MLSSYIPPKGCVRHPTVEKPFLSGDGFSYMAMATLSDPRKERYVQWLVTAPREREPSTATALADDIGVGRRTLYDWRHEKEFLAEWDDRARAIAGDPEKTTMVLDALFQQACDSESPKQIQAAKAWADIAGVIRAPKVEEHQSGQSLTELSSDELDAMLAELLAARQ